MWWKRDSRCKNGATTLLTKIMCSTWGCAHTHNSYYCFKAPPFKSMTWQWRLFSGQILSTFNVYITTEYSSCVCVFARVLLLVRKTLWGTLHELAKQCQYLMVCVKFPIRKTQALSYWEEGCGQVQANRTMNLIRKVKVTQRAMYSFSAGSHHTWWDPRQNSLVLSLTLPTSLSN